MSRSIYSSDKPIMSRNYMYIPVRPIYSAELRQKSVYLQQVILPPLTVLEDRHCMWFDIQTDCFLYATFGSGYETLTWVIQHHIYHYIRIYMHLITISCQRTCFSDYVSKQNITASCRQSEKLNIYTPWWCILLPSFLDKPVSIFHHIAYYIIVLSHCTVSEACFFTLRFRCEGTACFGWYSTHN